MGLYDYVNVPEIDCPKCGEHLRDWQSKDGECYLNILEFSEVNNFYTSCNKCGAGINFKRKIPVDSPLSDYEMMVTPPSRPGCSLCDDPAGRMEEWMGVCPRCKREIPTVEQGRAQPGQSDE